MVDPTPWAEFGLAGLFGIFALILTGLFLNFQAKQMDAWREALTGLNETIRKLSEAVANLDGSAK
jgi:hypothetical protein